MAAAGVHTSTNMDVESKGIDATPQAGQNITYNGVEYTTIKEGLAHILVPKGTPTSIDPQMSKEDTQKQQVFYNPIQQFNRDLSVLAIKTFGDDLVHRRIQKREQQQRRLQAKKRRKPEGDGQQQEDGMGVRELKKRKVAEDNVASVVPEGHNGAKDSVNTGDGAAVCHSEAPDAETSMDPQANQEHREWRPPFTILDALSATGLRALRYAKEIPYATSITANDISSKATEAIKLNVKHNNLESKVQANAGNAIAHMYSFVDQKGYDVIDLDPYGTAAPFIDAAIQAINDEGLLCVTCTDSAIFASHGYLEKTYSQYGGLPMIGESCHEGGLRLLLHAIGSSAGRYGMAIEPLLSLSIDYYIRVFVRVRRSPSDVKLLAGKTMIVYHCKNGCGAWSTQYLARHTSRTNKDGTAAYKHSFSLAPSADKACEHCGKKTQLSGPMYGGPLHNVGFIQRILAQLNDVDKETYGTSERIEGMLHTAMEEITFGYKEKNVKPDEPAHLDPLIPKADPAALDEAPFFFNPSSLSKVLHCLAPSAAAVRGALRHAGFKVTMSHCKPGSIRTNASWPAIWHIMLEWVRQKAPLKNPLKQGSPGYSIVAKGTAHQVAQKIPEAGSIDTPVGQSSGAQESSAVEPQAEASGEPGAAEPERPSYLGTNFEVIFDEKLGKDHDRGKYVRYQLAPRENWGPMARAK
ncbi:TRM-domain-containing protein [Westerdykella ornata]|uniref:tRNA (guanine(26)-N(2))-dimethyltransferase n=1 Tax=Westerdykella ornata TaxID=318751 RepID=A0A6A6J6J4_WESOR|nr:TRM-domain-containing protein [Westerdykella ornata]KAF2271834.1 TRM-domain-containing protein [Westerdykella ornata]